MKDKKVNQNLTEWDYPTKSRTRSTRLHQSKKHKSLENNLTLKPIKKEKRKGNINYLKYWDVDMEDI
jgi:hypothetical protein